MQKWLLALAAAALFAGPLRAENEISLYSGSQGASASDVIVRDHIDIGDSRFRVDWQGKPFAMPPYYGVRWTRWAESGFGWGAEFTHSKVYADDATLETSGFSALEMTDGLNIITVNALYRWQRPGRSVTPYVGAGAGIAVPHFEATTERDHTYGYQTTGPAVRLMAGASYRIDTRWSVFAEAQVIRSWNRARLEAGGSLRTDITTMAVNIGLSYTF